MTALGDRETWLADMPTVGELFPAGTRRLSYRPSRSPALLVLPSRRSPRLLVPSDLGSAGEMFRRHNTNRLQRLGQDVLALALWSRLLPMLPIARLVPAGDAAAGPTIEAHVRRHVPGAAHVGVLLGPPRANAKPVLRVFDAAGHTVAFGKVGHDALSTRLVRGEAQVLAELGAQTFEHLEVPKVIHSGAWRGLEVLYITPMQASLERESSWELPLPAMLELAAASGTSSAPVAQSAYAARLTARVRAVGQDGLPAVLAGVLALVGDVVLTFGRWHGDWAPWNTGATEAGRLQVWDWERSDAVVPVGFDAVHFLLQREFRDGSTPARAAAALLPNVAAALSGRDLRHEQIEATVLLYLVEILQRYVADAAGTPTLALQHRLSTVHALIATISADRSRELRADA